MTDQPIKPTEPPSGKPETPGSQRSEQAKAKLKDLEERRVRTNSMRVPDFMKAAYETHFANEIEDTKAEIKKLEADERKN